METFSLDLFLSWKQWGSFRFRSVLRISCLWCICDTYHIQFGAHINMLWYSHGMWKTRNIVYTITEMSSMQCNVLILKLCLGISNYLIIHVMCHDLEYCDASQLHNWIGIDIGPKAWEREWICGITFNLSHLVSFTCGQCCIL